MKVEGTVGVVKLELVCDAFHCRWARVYEGLGRRMMRKCIRMELMMKTLELLLVCRDVLL